MPRDITITFADGTQHVYRGAPDDLTPDAVQARAQQEFGKRVTSLDGGRRKAEPGMLESVVMGGLRGVKDVIDTGADWLASGFDKIAGTSEGDRVRQMNASGKSDFERDYGDSTTATVARVGGNIAATWPVGGALSTGARLANMPRLAQSLATGGMSTGAAVAPALSARAADMGIRMAGGAGTGLASASLVDPNAATTGATVGALLPPVARVAGASADLVGSMVRPFTRSGQERIAGNVLRSFATNPGSATDNLARASEVIPGSAPTAVMAAGDEGLAGLSRTLQSVDPRYASELSARQAAQNAARTTAMEGAAGNTGRLAVAREARDTATGGMREAVLDAAGALPARPVLDSIDRLMADPNNAGKLAQSALADFRSRIAQWAPDGQIDSRALYAIRKDINDVLEGKLQGEAGNLRYASGQLVKLKGIIDDAIDKASRRVEMSAGRELMPAGANIERAGVAGQYGSTQPRPTWGGYLDEYTQRSIPINQMEKMDEVLRAISTGTVDQSGNAILSAAKLNNLLRNQGKELQRVLSPEQLDLLRRLAADLNASQLAANTGRAVGSNTVQNLAGSNVLTQMLGNRLGGSTPVQTTIGRGVQFAYRPANAMIQNRLAAALLDPAEAARLMAPVPRNRLFEILEGPERLGYQAAPVISAQ